MAASAGKPPKRPSAMPPCCCATCCRNGWPKSRFAMNLVIQGGALPTFLLERIVAATGASTVEPRPPQVVRLKGANRTPEFDALIPLIEAENLDWAFTAADRKLSDFGLICFDMDSTLITIECIDELADFAGKKEEVSAVTEAAMRGEIDYRESLRQRLALLAEIGRAHA